MTYAKDSGPAVPEPGTENPWLARIKAEAALRQADRDVSALSEDELLDEAARGIAQRRAVRHDFIGALVWEEIAEGPRTPTPSEPAVPRAEDSGTSAVKRAGRD
ncbi:hypothetical protein [Streptomyces sp. NPDC060187]|uniref:hypothetical protein n=1 Tax=Streptomyces sp. NPDC060187 TaxID=3347067 RepID=UPI0036508836